MSNCLCVEKPYQHFQGDSPLRIADIFIDTHDSHFPDTWRVHCLQCGTAWTVALIPYGGIYGDFDWQRV